ncbi:hypothetical protein [Actinoplanes siamensis]|uniref:Uncharacterized protein n=1 Tax=Actinoplanes siamensis TaxID=1223317 RepID=A0A919NDE3_9ACTN|nr:hypothetical protein [Actinoplanes siamensis]GIF09133.1 hypothetical protein Asi03nite_66710 [Actinoplanes siamensis]
MSFLAEAGLPLRSFAPGSSGWPIDDGRHRGRIIAAHAGLGAGVDVGLAQSATTNTIPAADPA